MKHPSYLRLRPNSRYFQFRIKIPEDLRQHFEGHPSHIERSLRTASKREANALAAQLAASLQRQFEALRAGEAPDTASSQTLDICRTRRPSMPQRDDEESLRRQLEVAYVAIEEMLPIHISEFYEGRYRVTSTKEGREWWKLFLDEIVQHSGAASHDRRVPCPLCGRGAETSLSSASSGFVYPDGILRHLMGYGNAHQCPVTKALEDHAKTDWNERFAAVDRAAVEAELQAHVNR